MILIVILWLTLFFLSFGVLGLKYVTMKNAAKKPWRLKIDTTYMPKVSIIVPTLNESQIIGFKLKNLSMLQYPKELIEIIIVDSKSNDGTVDVVNDFIRKHPNMSEHIKVVLEREKKGKSAALNIALKRSTGDVVIISDADCFWPPNILSKSLCYLADSSVGAISGSKILLNPKQSWVTKSEEAYLSSINKIKLGESKIYSTLFFEGGFSAYKREAIEKFDPYSTGSDDCGTIIKMMEQELRAITVPEAKFYTTFPKTWRGKIGIKLRRANQLIRVFSTYFILLLKNQIKTAKGIVVQNTFLYLFCPVIFVLLLLLTLRLLLSFPLFSLILLVLFIPKLGLYLFETIQNYLILFISIFSTIFIGKFFVWKKPEDRFLLTREMLEQYNLI